VNQNNEVYVYVKFMFCDRSYYRLRKLL